MHNRTHTQSLNGELTESKRYLPQERPAVVCVVHLHFVIKQMLKLNFIYTFISAVVFTHMRMG